MGAHLRDQTSLGPILVVRVRNPQPKGQPGGPGARRAPKLAVLGTFGHFRPFSGGRCSLKPLACPQTLFSLIPNGILDFRRDQVLCNTPRASSFGAISVIFHHFLLFLCPWAPGPPIPPQDPLCTRSSFQPPFWVHICLGSHCEPVWRVPKTIW